MSVPTYVRVLLGAEHYAIDVNVVAEVAPFGEVMPMPGMPSHLLGVRNLRGEAVPVVDLGALAGAGGDPERRAVVVLDDGGRRAALTVDEILDVSPLPPPSDAEPASGLAVASTLVDGALVGILDHTALLAAAAWRPAA